MEFIWAGKTGTRRDENLWELRAERAHGEMIKQPGWDSNAAIARTVLCRFLMLLFHANSDGRSIDSEV